MAGNYPIVLSDALLGRATKEVYTGIRYNHKATDTSCSPPPTISRRLKPSDEEQSRFNLSFSDQPDKVSYHGGRTVGEGQYILIFDAAKEQFVLHRLDSSFEMMPIPSSNCQLKSNSKSPQPTQQKKLSRASNKAHNGSNDSQRRKADKPKKIKQPIREPTPEEDESDDGLTIEYPGGSAPPEDAVSPVPVYRRRMSDVSENNENNLQEDESGQNFDDLQLPSPALNPTADISDEDIEMALEAELEQELLKESAGHTIAEAESDESEEE